MVNASITTWHGFIFTSSLFGTKPNLDFDADVACFEFGGDDDRVGTCGAATFV